MTAAAATGGGLLPVFLVLALEQLDILRKSIESLQLVVHLDSELMLALEAGVRDQLLSKFDEEKGADSKDEKAAGSKKAAKESTKEPAKGAVANQLPPLDAKLDTK